MSTTIAGFDYQRVPVAEDVALNVAVGAPAARSCCCTASRRPT